MNDVYGGCGCNKKDGVVTVCEFHKAQFDRDSMAVKDNTGLYVSTVSASMFAPTGTANCPMVPVERHGDPRFYALLNEVAELHSRKNHDYAKDGEPLSNFHRSLAFGIEPWRGILVRMSDKWSRIEELSKGKTAKNESLRDSLIDNAVYSLLCVLLMEDAAP